MDFRPITSITDILISPWTISSGKERVAQSTSKPLCIPKNLVRTSCKTCTPTKKISILAERCTVKKKIFQPYNPNLTTWNIKTMLDKPNSNRPKREGRHNISRAPKTQHWHCGSEWDSLKVIASKKRQTTETGKLHLTEVNRVWLLQSWMVFCGLCLRFPPVIERLILLRFSFVDNRNCTLVPGYAPTVIKTTEKISIFYNQLNQILRAILNANKIVLLGNYHARIGQ